jgi:hypothetical protein
VLDFYGVSTMMPTAWPAEKNDKTDDSDSEHEQKKKLNRRKSRYQALERAVSNRSSIMAGSEKSASGVSNLVQRDEPDPLGSSDSVVRTLKELGVPIQDDPRLRKSTRHTSRFKIHKLTTRLPSQAIASFCPQLAFRLPCFSPRCTPMPTQRPC